ncbi:MAG: ECF-type sigma factor [Roseateles sp.]|uniref:ECF-type sigma factor n=1 Tax=Roseateles sp. TaxID=1971397 RepID=UPI0040350111
MQDITQRLKAAAQGDRAAGDEVVALLYDDLRRQARRQMRQSGKMTLLNTTALVHEVWLRLADPRGPGREFPDRRHFLAYAARAMRTVVIDLIRARQADKRGAGLDLLTLDTALAEETPQREDDILRVHEALEELAQCDPRLAQVVEMRYFAGLAERDIAEVLGVAERTVQRDWQKARLFLAESLCG